MIILAVDIGAKTGWALSRNGVLASGTEKFESGRWSGGGMKFLLFAGWLDKVLSQCDKIDAVYYEEVRHHAGTDAAHAYGGFMAHLTAWAEKNSIPYDSIPVGTIKKHATGSGAANKLRMVERAKELWPEQRVIDDNQADALHILRCAIHQLGNTAK